MFPGFSVGSVYVNAYGICAAVGLLAGFAPAVLRYKRKTGEYLPLMLVLVWAALGAAVGMHLLFGLTNIARWNEFSSAESFWDRLSVFRSLFGGSVFYGGLLGGLAAGMTAVKIMRLPADAVTDALAPAIAVFHGFARIGCFCSGCCYGIEWEHGITFRHSMVESADSVPRVPVQLFEAGFEFLLGAVLRSLPIKAPKAHGKLLPLYLSIYSVGRFFLEFLRGDEYRGYVGALSTSQFISIFVFVLGGVWLLRAPRKRE